MEKLTDKEKIQKETHQRIKGRVFTNGDCYEYSSDKNLNIVVHNYDVETKELEYSQVDLRSLSIIEYRTKTTKIKKLFGKSLLAAEYEWEFLGNSKQLEFLIEAEKNELPDEIIEDKMREFALEEQEAMRKEDSED